MVLLRRKLQYVGTISEKFQNKVALSQISVRKNECKTAGPSVKILAGL